VIAAVRFLAVVSLLACAARPLAAQRHPKGDDWLASCRDRDWGDDSRAHYCEVRNAGFKSGGGAVSVAPGENGAIRITGWDKDSVDVTAKIQTHALTDDEAQALARQITITASGGTISADGPATSGRRSWSVSFDVMVPRRTDLTARTENGPIAVDDVAGSMDLHGENGPLHLSNVAGDVHARTVNGPLVVTLSGDHWDGTGLDSETENGPVVLTLPARYSAHLVTGTVNGPLTLDIPVTMQGRIDFHHVETDIGSGGPQVRAVTTNGPVTVRHD
jgi:hypothetical protein